MTFSKRPNGRVWHHRCSSVRGCCIFAWFYQEGGSRWRRGSDLVVALPSFLLSGRREEAEHWKVLKVRVCWRGPAAERAFQHSCVWATPIKNVCVYKWRSAAICLTDSSKATAGLHIASSTWEDETWLFFKWSLTKFSYKIPPYQKTMMSQICNFGLRLAELILHISQLLADSL